VNTPFTQRTVPDERVTHLRAAFYAAGRSAWKYARLLVHVAYHELVRLLFDRRYGFQRDTAVTVPLERFGLAAPERVEYEPSPWFILARILPRSEVAAEDVFLDFGAGMGRAVFQAAKRYAFRRVIGVELVEQFARAARLNVERNLHRLRCRDVEIVSCDVLTYEVPDDVTIAYFNNPFRGDLFAAAVDRLLASVDRRPRRLRIIYRNPVEHDRLLATGRIREVRHARRLVRRWSRTGSMRLYAVDPLPAASRSAGGPGAGG
jgi:hypothetical protein